MSNRSLQMKGSKCYQQKYSNQSPLNPTPLLFPSKQGIELLLILSWKKFEVQKNSKRSIL